MEDVKNLCRICLENIRENLKCKSVFDKDKNDIKIAKKIYDTSGIFIEKTDYLPEKICLKCDQILNLAYIFRLTCQESDIKLKESAFTADIVQIKLIKTESNLEELLNEVNNAQNLEVEKVEIDSKILFEYQELSSVNDDVVEQNSEENTSNENHDKKIENISKPLRKKRRHIEWKEGKKPTNRRLCKFNKLWFDEYKWIQQGEDQYYATCSVCKCQFSISHGGRADISRHVNTEKHKQNTDPLLVKEKVFRGNGIKVPQNVSEITYIICEICGNKYSSKTHLRRHMKYHSDVLEFECEICQKKFRLSMQLRKHMRVHTGEKPYECRFCGKRFTDFSSKLKHERSHTNERPYSCDTCGKTFTSSGVCKKHKRIHTGEKPHHCEICDKSFAEKAQLVTHFKSFLHQSRKSNAIKSSIKKEPEVK